jgi:hypothetical protein
MTINEPSLDSNKDAASLAWEKSVTEATNRMQHQIDNINESVNTSPSLVAVYARTLDGKGQQFTPFEEANGYVAYVPYTDAYPTLPLTGITFAEYSNEAIDFVIKQYRETANRPANPGSVSYTVSGGSWTASTNWDKTKLNRSGTNIWFCEAKIIGSAGETVTAKWSDPKLLYGGAVATGILYYNTAQTSAPSAPSVDTSGTATGAVIDGYDYDSGVFSLGNDAALSTLGWQYVPITVAMSGANSINKKHWQVSFHVETLEVTNQAGTAPGQIITFGTVEGFIPIGSVLQSDNFNGDLSNGTQGTQGWGISRTGNSIFNGVQVRGALNADDITAGSLAAARIASTTINADNITAGDLSATRIKGGTLTVGDVDVSGAFNAANLNVGVIISVNSGSGATGTFFTFTSANEDEFNTDIVVIGSTTASQGTNTASTGNITAYVSHGGTAVSLGGVAVGGSYGTGSRASISAQKIQVGKGVTIVGYAAGGVGSEPASITASVTCLEVRRV